MVPEPKYSYYVSGTVPGSGEEAVNKAGGAPKGQKTDKQVITTEGDETDNLVAPGS